MTSVRTTPAAEAEAADADGSTEPLQPEPAVDLTTALQQSIEQRRPVGSA